MYTSIIFTSLTAEQKSFAKKCQEGKLDEIQKEFSTIKQLNFYDEKGASPVIQIVENKNLTAQEKEILIKMFITKGANVNLAHKFTGKTALHVAAENNHVKIMTLLLANKAAIDTRDTTEFGATPLIFCAGFEGNAQAIEVLVKSGANINERAATTVESMTALHFAAQEGAVGNIIKLIEMKADIHLKTHSDQSAMDLLIEAHAFKNIGNENFNMIKSIILTGKSIVKQPAVMSNSADNAGQIAITDGDSKSVNQCTYY